MKKIFNKTSIAVIVAATFFSAIPVFGATNINWSGNAQTPGESIWTGERKKTTDSSVIANYSEGGSEFLSVTVYARVNGSLQNCTYYSNSHPAYYAYKGSSNYIDVLNTVYERYGERYITCRFVTSTAGNHSGKWRPDFQ